MDGWRPIATAPDDEWVLVAVPVYAPDRSFKHYQIDKAHRGDDGKWHGIEGWPELEQECIALWRPAELKDIGGFDPVAFGTAR